MGKQFNPDVKSIKNYEKHHQTLDEMHKKVYEKEYYKNLKPLNPKEDWTAKKPRPKWTAEDQREEDELWES